MYPTNMVCFRYIIVKTLHKGMRRRRRRMREEEEEE
jgi:hypothetical protein